MHVKRLAATGEGGSWTIGADSHGDDNKLLYRNNLKFIKLLSRLT